MTPSQTLWCSSTYPPMMWMGYHPGMGPKKENMRIIIIIKREVICEVIVTCRHVIVLSSMIEMSENRTHEG